MNDTMTARIKSFRFTLFVFFIFTRLTPLIPFHLVGLKGKILLFRLLTRITPGRLIPPLFLLLLLFLFQITPILLLY
jgi:hypothetical protein